MSLSFDERVRVKAYEIWEAEGRVHGLELQHWAKAREAVGAAGERVATSLDGATAEPAYRIALGTVYTFGVTEAEPWLTAASGLSFPEDTVRWTDGARASLVFHLPDDCPDEIVIQLDCRGAVSPNAPSVTADVSIDGVQVGIVEDDLRGGPRLEQAVFPVPHLTRTTSRIDLTLAIRDPRRPSDTGMGPDDRELGFLLVALVVRPA